MKMNYNTETGKLLTIPLEENICKPKVDAFFLNSVFRSFKESIYHNKRKIRAKISKPISAGKSEELKYDISFDGSIYSGKLVKIGFTNGDFTYKVNLQGPVETKFNIKKTKIGQGTFSECYYMEHIDDSKKYVAKIPQVPATSVSNLKCEIEINLLTTHLSISFNKYTKQFIEGSKRFKVFPLVILEVKGIEEIIGGKKFILAQEYLSGDYVKYNNNYGWVNNTIEMKTEANKMAQAFSHFTFEESKGCLIVVDIQGTVNKNGDLEITDPAIHTEFYEKRFGPTNLGKLGIVKFFRTHECNDICKRLQLLNPRNLDCGLQMKQCLATSYC